MNKKIFFKIFVLFFLFITSSLLFLFPNKSEAVECCTGLCTTERFAECNGISSDFCSICTNSTYFYYRCPQISCGACSDFYCNGSCGSACTATQDPDCAGSCCGDGSCDVSDGENLTNCLVDCSSTCIADSCNGICPTNCSATDDPDCAGSCCGDGICNGGETNAFCSTDCSPVCSDNDHDGYGNPASTACPNTLLDCNDSNYLVRPGATEACDGIDNNCDGVIDEGCSCINGNKQMCGSNIGLCSYGVQTCYSGSWGACVGEVSPAAELCDGLDNDCDNNIDETCSCTSGATQVCGTNTGVCREGTQTCFLGSWGVCTGSIAPSKEICDGLDNDCNASIDDGLVSPLNSNQNGVCAGSFKSCSGTGGWINDYSGVANNEWPNELSCSDGLDNDCDGKTDNLDIPDCLSGCTLDSECNDSNPCTIDSCNSGTCEYGNEVNGAENCGSGCERCWAPNTSTLSVCSPWDSDCDDGNECTADACVADVCTSNNEPSTVSCSVGYCNGLGSCVGGSCTDDDGDGYNQEGGLCGLVDCDDGNLNINPGEVEICGNGIDEDCLNGDAVCSSLIVTIDQPTDNIFKDISYINFSVIAVNGTLPYEYIWESDIDGVLYSGYKNSITVGGLSGTKLSLGTHNITVTVVDAEGSSVSLSKTINIIPSTSFSSLISLYGNTFAQGVETSFYSAASGGAQPYSYEWSSDKDGVLGGANYLRTSTLSLGSHIITLKTTDANNNTYLDNREITIVSGPVIENVYPGNKTIEYGTLIFPYVSHRGGTEPVSVSVVSSISGVLSTAREADRGIILEKGLHQVTINVEDALGLTDSETVYWEVFEPECLDEDGDGYGKIYSSACSNTNLDCDDDNPSINPGVEEICGNSVDENCNGSIIDCPFTFSFISPEVDNKTYNWGQQLDITVKPDRTGISYMSAYIYDSENIRVNSISLRDNGTGFDDISGDNIFKGASLLTSTGVYTIVIQYSVEGTYLMTETLRTFTVAEGTEPVCQSVVNNGSSEDKLDIVYIADQYTASELGTFATKLEDSKDYLLGFIPYSNNASKINIHRVDSVVDLDCGGDGALCTTASLARIASVCPYDIVIALVDRSFRSYAYFSGYTMVSATESRYRWTVVHELGHAFGKLADEYVEGGKTIPANVVDASKNCDTDSNCSKWGGFTGTGCYDGCYYNNGYYRSINSGVMRTSLAPDYGVWNIKELNLVFDAYK